ncbi:hypothetical protein L2E82_44043 [Cichorium intybus]|uniref:Uncharacterized protein n=1 Tax=Cichorium intybus TaxID=13427 RepID=A0ACB8ZPJ2_CICIN|nr:hypothetical protein L2E82_44043 [Cichorium intybus]
MKDSLMEISFHITNDNTQFVGDENRPSAQLLVLLVSALLTYLRLFWTFGVAYIKGGGSLLGFQLAKRDIIVTCFDYSIVL